MDLAPHETQNHAVVFNAIVAARAVLLENEPGFFTRLVDPARGKRHDQALDRLTQAANEVSRVWGWQQLIGTDPSPSPEDSFWSVDNPPLEERRQR